MYSFSYIVFKNVNSNLSVFVYPLVMMIPFKFPLYQIQFELKVKNKISDPLFQQQQKKQQQSPAQPIFNTENSFTIGFNIQ